MYKRRTRRISGKQLTAEEDGAYKKGKVKPSAIYRLEITYRDCKGQAHVYTGLISGCVI